MSTSLAEATGHPTGTSPLSETRDQVRHLVARLWAAVSAGEPWEGGLLELTMYLWQQAVPALDGDPELSDLLAAQADRLPMVQDPAEALRIADHVLYLLDRTAWSVTP